MMVGGYSLHLYCDGSRHKELHPNKFTSIDADFSGHARGDCIAQAKEKGWKLTGGQAFCGVCRAYARKHHEPLILLTPETPNAE